MYLHGLLRAVEAAPAFHQPYHLHCTNKAGFPGAFYNILLPCGQLVQKIQKRAIPTKGRHIAHAHTHHIVICMHWRIFGHTGTLHQMEGKIRFWAIPHQSNIMIILCSAVFKPRNLLIQGQSLSKELPSLRLPGTWHCLPGNPLRLDAELEVVTGSRCNPLALNSSYVGLWQLKMLKDSKIFQASVRIKVHSRPLQSQSVTVTVKNFQNGCIICPATCLDARHSQVARCGEMELEF